MFTLTRKRRVQVAHVTDVCAMERCLDLAERGRRRVGINPMVGSVLVRKSKVIAEGWHEKFGEPHAERNTLNKLLVHKDDFLYVNLEPCFHQGKTPPCTNAIIESGVQHVVFGMKDPNKQVSGKGIAALRDAGIDVRGPVLPERCARLNRGYVSLQNRGRPWITLKCAKMVGGSIAHDDGSPLKITNATQDEWSHTKLRAKHDAILVGGGTVKSDNPQLTVRYTPEDRSTLCVGSNNKLEQTSAQPIGLILNPTYSISPDANLVRPGTIMVIDTKLDAAEEIVQRGVRVIKVPVEDGQFVWSELWKALTTPTPGFDGIASILVEGGPRTWKTFKDAGCVDEETVLVGN